MEGLYCSVCPGQKAAEWVCNCTGSNNFLCETHSSLHKIKHYGSKISNLSLKKLWQPAKDETKLKVLKKLAKQIKKLREEKKNIIKTTLKRIKALQEYLEEMLVKANKEKKFYRDMIDSICSLKEAPIKAKCEIYEILTIPFDKIKIKNAIDKCKPPEDSSVTNLKTLFSEWKKQESINQKSKERCPNYHDCKNLLYCNFSHPVKTCEFYPNCKYGDACKYRHIKTNCKYGKNCRNVGCQYLHVELIEKSGNSKSKPLQSVRVNRNHYLTTKSLI
ncbi:unnamed protein product [Blepharisma stoltei]|uniref:C3H1-type domain-containing protein n=1 Tax=Blepharisma stoltei TaxID=1481888 RepID=A0AAU9IJ33_9CILI|nr:unnamed protein product [Blepharisma stoltei]